MVNSEGLFMGSWGGGLLGGALITYVGSMFGRVFVLNKGFMYGTIYGLELGE